nr:hypothetical protein [Tanacetum cinerariifolium]
MSDSEDFTITYTAVSSPFRGLSDIRSPGVGGPPVMPEDPYAYVVAVFQAPPSLDYVPGPEYPHSPEFPLPAAALPTTESDLDEDPEDDPEEDPEDDLEANPIDYPADGADEGDDEDESSDDDEDDDIDIEGDEKEDEYLAPDDSTAVAFPAIDHALSTPISLLSDIEIPKLMAIPTPLPSPLSPLSSPLPHIPSPPLPLLSPPPIDPTYKEAPLGYRETILRWRAERGDYRGVPAASKEVMHCSYWFVDIVERGEGSTPAAMEVGYGIIDTWDDLVGAIQETTPTTVESRPHISDYSRDTAGGDQGVAGSITQATGTVHTGTDCTEVMSDSADCSSRMHSDLRGRQSSSTARALGRNQILEAARVPTQPVGVAKALAARDADRKTNADDSHVSGTETIKANSNNRTRGRIPAWLTLRDLVKTNLMEDLILCALSATITMSTANVNTTNNQRGNGTGQKPTCYEYGAQGHFKKDYPKLKNNNHSTQDGNATTPAKVYVVGRAGINLDSNVVTGTFLLNNRYASILFDTGADRSFVSTAFSSQIEITSITLDHYYDVK